MNEKMNEMIHKDDIERMIKEAVKRAKDELRKVQQKLTDIKRELNEARLEDSIKDKIARSYSDVIKEKKKM